MVAKRVAPAREMLYFWLANVVRYLTQSWAFVTSWCSLISFVCLKTLVGIYGALFCSHEYYHLRIRAWLNLEWPTFVGTRILDTLTPLIARTTMDELSGLSTAYLELDRDKWGVLKGMSKRYSMSGLFLRGVDLNEGYENR